MNDQQKAAELRQKLESIQRLEPKHLEIGKPILVGGIQVTIEGKPLLYSLRQICPKCPKRKACKEASVALADVETKILGRENTP